MGAFFNRFLMGAKKIVASGGPVRKRPLEQARRDFNEDAPARAEAKAIAEAKAKVRETARIARLIAKAEKEAKATAEAEAKAIEDAGNERAALVEREQARGA